MILTFKTLRSDIFAGQVDIALVKFMTVLTQNVDETGMYCTLCVCTPIDEERVLNNRNVCLMYSTRHLLVIITTSCKSFQKRFDPSFWPSDHLLNYTIQYTPSFFIATHTHPKW
jgi:hypothetical protein